MDMSVLFLFLKCVLTFIFRILASWKCYVCLQKVYTKQFRMFGISILFVIWNIYKSPILPGLLAHKCLFETSSFIFKWRNGSEWILNLSFSYSGLVFLQLIVSFSLIHANHLMTLVNMSFRKLEVKPLLCLSLTYFLMLIFCILASWKCYFCTSHHLSIESIY